MNLLHICRHLLTTHWHVRRAFSASTLQAIEQAIAASESSHQGELRFVIEGALDGAPLWRGQTARERAIDLFSNLRVWDTEHNSGVLIYVLLADRRVEIVADRGIHACCGADAWSKVCRAMEAQFAKGDFSNGSLRGIHEISEMLVQHFPAPGDDDNELPNTPIVL